MHWGLLIDQKKEKFRLLSPSLFMKTEKLDQERNPVELFYKLAKRLLKMNEYGMLCHRFIYLFKIIYKTVLDQELNLAETPIDFLDQGEFINKNEMVLGVFDYLHIFLSGLFI